MKNLIIFGTGKIAEVIHYYATQDCGYEVAGFTVDEPFRMADTFLGLPVVSFSEVEKVFPCEQYNIFVALGYHDLNKLRKKKCEEAMAKGYKLISVVSPKCNLPLNVSFGYNCFIMPPCEIHPCVKIENNVFIWSGAIVGHHSVLESDCWLTSGCNVSGNVVIGKNSFLAINATIGHSVSIGKECFIGANALITKNTAEKSVLINESTKPLRLNSDQFLKMSKFSSI